MEVVCPKCGKLVEESDIRPEEDTAFCCNCNQDFDLFEAVARYQAQAVDPDNLPKGIIYTTSPDGFAITAATHPVFGLGVLFFACVFLVGIVSSVQKTVASGEALVAQFWVFLSAAILFDAGLWLLAAHCIRGKVRVVVHKDEGKIAVGTGVLTWRKVFDWSRVSRIYPQIFRISKEGHETYRIVIRVDEEIVFGSWLTTERLAAFVQLLLRELVRRGIESKKHK